MSTELTSKTEEHTTQSHQLTQVPAKRGKQIEAPRFYDGGESIEKEWAGVGEKAEKREAALKNEVEGERRAREEAEQRVYQLEAVLGHMGRGELP
ncbi:hypothetical protein F5887DRAFT_1084625 [Amanita rubescens]|nr:hypothetical protein F5887DRAFT_1084625 [Amanita rubescens]